jgi:hypothetical protein
MSNTSVTSRTLVLFGIAVPLATVVGYLLALPDRASSGLIVGAILAFLAIPIFLRWHHPLLIITWNASMNAFFLPGRPHFWMIFAGISFGITVLGCILNKEEKFQHVPTVTWSLVLLLMVVLVTAKLTGGIGLRTFGGAQYGGKGYVFTIAAVLGYFALSSVRIPRERAQAYTLVYFLAGLAILASTIAYAAGPGFWFLFAVFPVEIAIGQALAEYTPHVTVYRIAGMGFASVAGCQALFLRYGIRGLLDVSKPWRLGLFLLIFGIGFAGGFRSTFVLIALSFGIQFWIEGLHRTRFFPAVFLAVVIAVGVLVPFAGKLPLAVQRTLTIIPFLPVSSVARHDAQTSLDWRLEMWKILLPELRHYFWVGKGYVINPTDMFLAEESARRGVGDPYQGVLVTGDYHSGPLSIVIPFGIAGVIAFSAVLFFGGRVLYRNWKFGAPELKNINQALFAFFLTKVIFYIFVFGAFYVDLAVFLGLVGLGIAVNGTEPQRQFKARSETVAVPALVPAHA